jgi:hypothetical protein
MVPPLAALLLVVSAALAPAAEHLRFTDPTQEFHPGFGEERVIAKYAFTNVGDSPITIRDLHTSCGCTTAKLDQRTYAPGESGAITATFVVEGRVGVHRKSISFTTDSDDQKEVVLTMVVHCPGDAAITPNELRWDVGGALDRRSSEVRFPSGSALRLKRALCDHKEAFAVELTGSGEVWKVAVTPISTAESVHAIVALESEQGPVFELFLAIDPPAK